MTILVLMHGGANSRDIFKDIVQGCRDAGHHVLILEISPLLSLSSQIDGGKSERIFPQIQKMIQNFIEENDVDLCLCMWGLWVDLLGMVRTDEKTIPFFEDIRCPVLQIWLDAPERVTHAHPMINLFRSVIVNNNYIYHYINNEGTAAEMLTLFGFANVIPLPYGINPRTFVSGVKQEKKYDIGYSIDRYDAWLKNPTPAMLEEVRKDEPDINRIRREEADKIRIQLRELARHWPQEYHAAIRESLDLLVDMQLQDRDVPMVDRLNLLGARRKDLQPAILEMVRNIPLYVQAAMMIRSIESFYRVFMFAYLARYFTCVHWGGADFSAWGINVSGVEYLPYNEIGKYYGQARLGLSVMRYQDDVGMHIKPLEIAASGTACVCAYRSGIEQILTPGKEVVSFRSPAEARAQITNLLAHPDQLQAIAHAGMQRTLRDHTWGIRMRLLLGVVEKLARQKGAWRKL